MEVVLSANRRPGPRGTGEKTGPVVGHTTVRGGIPPDIVVAVRPVRVVFRFHEPAVPVAAVVEHQIQQNADTVSVRGLDQDIHVFERSKNGIDIAVVADVVPVVHLRRPKNRTHPDRADSEGAEVGNTTGDPGKVSDAVAVAVLKTTGIYVVDRGIRPPGPVIHRRIVAWRSGR